MRLGLYPVPYPFCFLRERLMLPLQALDLVCQLSELPEVLLLLVLRSCHQVVRPLVQLCAEPVQVGFETSEVYPDKGACAGTAGRRHRGGFDGIRSLRMIGRRVDVRRWARSWMR